MKIAYDLCCSGCEKVITEKFKGNLREHPYAVIDHFGIFKGVFCKECKK